MDDFLLEAEEIRRIGVEYLERLESLRARHRADVAKLRSWYMTETKPIRRRRGSPQ